MLLTLAGWGGKTLGGVRKPTFTPNFAAAAILRKKKECVLWFTFPLSLFLFFYYTYESMSMDI